jgi:hypothetical protein
MSSSLRTAISGNYFEFLVISHSLASSNDKKGSTLIRYSACIFVCSKNNKSITTAKRSKQAVWRCQPSLLEQWHHGFESHTRHGCVSEFFCVGPSSRSRVLAASRTIKSRKKSQTLA